MSTTPTVTAAKGENTQTFSTTLRDGREVTIREMTGRDLIYMEKELGKLGEFEKAMRIVERLIVGDVKLTYDEIVDLGVNDYRRLNDLVEKANGDDAEGENSPK